MKYEIIVSTKRGTFRTGIKFADEKEYLRLENVVKRSMLMEIDVLSLHTIDGSISIPKKLLNTAVITFNKFSEDSD